MDKDQLERLSGRVWRLSLLTSCIRYGLLPLVALLCGVFGTLLWMGRAPVQETLSRLQGHWQLVEVSGRSRDPAPYYLTVEGWNTHSQQFDAAGQLVLEGHHHLETTGDPDLLQFRSTDIRRDYVWNEFYWHVDGDTLIQVRGVAPGDRIQTPTLYTWRRVDDVPTPSSAQNAD